MIDLGTHPRGVTISVRAHAGARKSAILGERQSALRIAVTAPPEKGKANQAIIELLGETLGVAKSAIELVAGETSPQKRFLILGANEQSIRQRLDRLDCFKEK
jgi:uncharacterized protein (TIGR00251 family)